MALSFNGIEPVSFGGKECTPKINTELKLRLSKINEYNDDTDDVLASAFPEDEEYVKTFLKDKMTNVEKQMLHVYLIGGEMMVNKILGKIDDTFEGASQND